MSKKAIELIINKLVLFYDTIPKHYARGFYRIIYEFPYDTMPKSSILAKRR